MDILNKLVITAYAAMGTTDITPPSKTLGFRELIGNILNGVYIIAGALAVIFLIYSGIQYITAGGDSAKATSARTGIVNAIIGIIVILLAFSVTTWAMQLVSNGLG